MEFSLKQSGILLTGYQTWAVQTIPNVTMVEKSKSRIGSGAGGFISAVTSRQGRQNWQVHNFFAIDDKCHLKLDHIQLQMTFSFRKSKR